MRATTPLVWALVMGGGCSRDAAIHTDTPGTSLGALDTGLRDPTTGTATEPSPGAGPFSALSWSVHPVVGSLIDVRWTQSAPGDVVVEYSVEPGVWERSPQVAGEVGVNEQTLVGIPFRTPDAEPEVPWRVVSVASGEQVAAPEPILPEPAPAGLPLPQVLASVPGEWRGGDWLLTSINEEHGGWTGGRYWVVIYDRRGRPVWARSVPNHHWSLFPQVSQVGGYLLWDESTRWSDDDLGMGSLVHRTWLDRELDVVPTPGLHHAFVELPDRTLAWGSLAPQHGPGEALVELEPGEEVPRIVWSCEEDWPAATTGCGSSGLFYDAASERYLLSFYTHDAVVEVERASGQTRWWAGSGTGSYAFAPREAALVQPHGASWTPGGRVLVSTEAEVERDGHTVLTTYLREFQVQHTERSLVEVWRQDVGIYSAINSYATRLEDRHTLHLLGSASEVVEIDVRGRRVWHLDFGGSQLLGRGELIEDLYALLEPPPPS